jgi:hypothetical protein
MTFFVLMETIFVLTFSHFFKIFYSIVRMFIFRAITEPRNPCKLKLHEKRILSQYIYIIMWSCPDNMPKYYPGLRHITRPKG